MRDYAKKPENQSRTLDSNPKASRQAPIDVILQRYQERNIQREELIRGKFNSVQREEIDEEEILQGKFESTSTSEQEPVQREEKPNNTGLPDNLKIGVENLSGHSMDDVKVHYNSDKPAQLQAHAYTQGTDIHVAPGQEQHLPHETWHVVQQMQGRVQPTKQLQGVNLNDNEGLEKEADMMGDNFNNPYSNVNIESPNLNNGSSPIQCLRNIKPSNEMLAENENHANHCIELLGINKDTDEFLSLGIYCVDSVPKEDLYEKIFNEINAVSENKIQEPTSSKLKKTKRFFDYSVSAHEKYEDIMSSGPRMVDTETEGIWHDIANDKGGAFYHPQKKIIIIQSDKYSKRDLLHELGHFKQYTTIDNIPDTLNPKQVQLLEYHNIVLNENLFNEVGSPTQSFGENKYMADAEGKYKRFKYNTPTVASVSAKIKMGNGLSSFETTMADEIIKELEKYDATIKEQINGQLLTDCADYFQVE